MGFIKTPIKGMNDFLPSDMRLREHVINMIKETYATYGFSLIETPVMEHLGNLTGKQGGEAHLPCNEERRGPSACNREWRRTCGFGSPL